MTGELPVPLAGPSHVRQTMDAVIDHIRREGLKVDSDLPGEAYFARELGVSRAVTREAFVALSALGTIDVGNGRRPRDGALDGAVFGATLNHGISTAQITVMQIWDVRRTLERRTAALAAMRRTDAEAAQILGNAQAMRTHFADRERVVIEDIALHQGIAAASRNPVYEQIIASFSQLMTMTVSTVWTTRRTTEERDRTLDEHLMLAEAIADRDVTAADAAMERHFDHAMRALIDAGVN